MNEEKPVAAFDGSITDDELLAAFDVPFRFSERPAPVLPRHRIAWGLSLVILILVLCSRGRRASLQKLHVLNWAVRNEENRKTFRKFLAGSTDPGAILIRYEPSLNRAIDFAAGEHLVAILDSGSIQLTEQGSSFAAELLAQKEVLIAEIAFFKELRLQVTEQMVTNLTRFI
ncbi:MAG TPA: hypothetical protein VGC13_06425 [Longimicrobium sp.]|jgi:hypothetical protein|uniref:hypothetical protein n=1 Tax=Longimicrobium sp. TaxID=2029185 RepID=UPI002ED79581